MKSQLILAEAPKWLHAPHEQESHETDHLLKKGSQQEGCQLFLGRATVVETSGVCPLCKCDSKINHE